MIVLCKILCRMPCKIGDRFAFRFGDSFAHSLMRSFVHSLCISTCNTTHAFQHKSRAFLRAGMEMAHRLHPAQGYKAQFSVESINHCHIAFLL